MILGPSYVYVCPHKTGTASMRQWLQTWHNGTPHGKYHSRDIPASHKDALVFMTVRNPYERLRSRWRFKASRGYVCTFPQLARLTIDDRSRLVDWRDDCGAREFLKLEFIDEEVKRLPFAGDEPPPLHERKTEGHENLTLTGEDRELVRELFAEDFEAFGYEM